MITNINTNTVKRNIETACKQSSGKIPYQQAVNKALQDEAVSRLRAVGTPESTVQEFIKNGIAYACNDEIALEAVTDFEKYKDMKAFAALPGDGFIDFLYVDSEVDWDDDWDALENGEAASFRVYVDEVTGIANCEFCVIDVDWDESGFFRMQ